MSELAGSGNTYGGATRHTYESASFGGSLKRGVRPWVVVVDFSYGFTDPDSPLGSDMSAAVSATRGLLDVARERSVGITYTTVGFEPRLSDAGLNLQKAPLMAELQLGSRWAEVDERLGRVEGEAVFVKKFPSALFGTPLLSLLVTHRVDTVVVCGAVTSGCIRASVIDLFSYGFPTLVPVECVADRAEGPHRANLFDIGAKYADVVSASDVADYFRRTTAPEAG